jgi:hypothetical protein
MPSGFQAFGSAEGYVGSGPTTPATVASTLGWWRADGAHDAGSSKCDALPAKFTNDSDANKNSTAAGAARPTIIAVDTDFNSLPSLSFGASEQLRTAVWTTPTSDPFWVFAVVKLTGDMYVCDDLAAGNRHSLFRSTNSLRGYETGFSFGAGLIDSSIHALIFVFDDTLGVSYIDSLTSADQHAVGSSGNLTGLTIGNYLGSGSGGAKIADIALGSGVPNASTVKGLMNYAYLRYGVGVAP